MYGGKSLSNLRSELDSRLTCLNELTFYESDYITGFDLVPVALLIKPCTCRMVVEFTDNLTVFRRFRPDIDISVNNCDDLIRQILFALFDIRAFRLDIDLGIGFLGTLVLGFLLGRLLAFRKFGIVSSVLVILAAGGVIVGSDLYRCTFRCGSDYRNTVYSDAFVDRF